MITTRIATIEDWEKLKIFFSSIYRKNHPLHSFEFWKWQYGNEKYGRSFIALDENLNIVGHVGATFGSEIAWIINVYLDESCRGKGVLGGLYGLARNFYPLAATAANEAGLGLYRNMRWYRYHNLIRYVKLNPYINVPLITENYCKEIEINIKNLSFNETNYFKQPGIEGVKLDCGSTAFNQSKSGGLRFVDLKDIDKAEQQAWCLGYLWIDYITSWNDLIIKDIEKNNWVTDDKSIIPWRLDPLENGYFCDITFLSEKPLDNNFIVHRSYSDHGRIGSLIINENEK